MDDLFCFFSYSNINSHNDVYPALTSETHALISQGYWAGIVYNLHITKKLITHVPHPIWYNILIIHDLRICMFILQANITEHLKSEIYPKFVRILETTLGANEENKNKSGYLVGDSVSLGTTTVVLSTHDAFK